VLRVGLYRILPIHILYVYGIQKGAWGGSRIARSSCNSIAMVWAMQMGRGKKRRIRVHKSFEVNDYLVKAKLRVR